MISAVAGVELIAPTAHQPADKVGLNECKLDDENKIVECPAGQKPIFKSFENGKDRAVFSRVFVMSVLCVTSAAVSNAESRIVQGKSFFQRNAFDQAA